MEKPNNPSLKERRESGENMLGNEHTEVSSEDMTSVRVFWSQEELFLFV